MHLVSGKRQFYLYNDQLTSYLIVVYFYSICHCQYCSCFLPRKKIFIFDDILIAWFIPSISMWDKTAWKLPK